MSNNEIAAHQTDTELPNATSEIFARLGETVISRLQAASIPDNVTGVHDLRVAIRRLRTALRDLAPALGSKDTEKVAKSLRQVARLAGKVRDQDVAIGVLEKQAAASPDGPAASGYEHMIASRRERRARAFAELDEMLTSEFIEKLVGQIRTLADRTEEPIGVEDLDGLRTSVISQRRREFLELVPCLTDPYDIEGHHKLRIAVKRLRYSVELFSASADGADRVVPDEIAKMQDYLGAKHDCDLWIRRLRKGFKKHLKDDGRVTSQFVAGEELLGKFVLRGAKNYRKALNLWNSWRESDFLTNLELGRGNGIK